MSQRTTTIAKRNSKRYPYDPTNRDAMHQRERNRIADEADQHLRLDRAAHANAIYAAVRLVLILVVLGLVLYGMLALVAMKDDLKSLQKHTDAGVAAEPIAKGEPVSYLEGTLHRGLGLTKTTHNSGIPIDATCPVISTSLGYSGCNLANNVMTTWTVDDASRTLFSSQDTLPAMANASSSSSSSSVQRIISRASSTQYGDVVVTWGGGGSNGGRPVAHIKAVGASGGGYDAVARALTKAAVRSPSATIRRPTTSPTSPSSFAVALAAGALIGYDCGSAALPSCCIDVVAWGGDHSVRGHLTTTGGGGCPHSVVEHQGYFVLPGQQTRVIAVDGASGRPFLQSTVALPFAADAGAVVGASAELPPGAAENPQVVIGVSIGHEAHLYAVALQTASGQAAFVQVGVSVSLRFPQASDRASIDGLVYHPYQRRLVAIVRNGQSVMHCALVDTVAWGVVSPLVPVLRGLASRVHIAAFSPGARNALVVVSPSSSGGPAAVQALAWEGGMQFAGLAEHDAAKGESLKFVKRGLSQGHRSLRAGSPYAVGPNATLMLASDASGVFPMVGTARNPTDLDVGHFP